MATNKKYISLENLGIYDEKIKKVITDGDAATLKDAKDYADSLASNYEAAGSVESAEARANAYTDTEVKKATDAAAAAQAQADKGVTDAATADGKAVAAQGAVDSLSTYVGQIPEGATATDVVGYVDEKTAGIAKDSDLGAVRDRVTQAEEDIAAIEADYLTSSDKEELAGDIQEVQTAVNNEKTRAEGVESGLNTRLATVEGDYLKASDKEELQGNIDTLSDALEILTEGVDANDVDGVKDLIAYVKEHGPEVTGMKEDIADNAAAIETEKGRAQAAEQENAAAAATAQATAEAAQAAADTEKSRAEGVESGLNTRLLAVESAIGESGSVAEDIEAAKNAAIEAAAADAKDKADAAESAAKTHATSLNTAMDTRVGALETESATHAKQSDLTALTTRVTTAEGEIDTLQAEMDAVEALAATNKAAHEANAAAILLKASQADHEALAARVKNNEDGIAAFVPADTSDINKLFE